MLGSECGRGELRRLGSGGLEEVRCGRKVVEEELGLDLGHSLGDSKRNGVIRYW